MSKYWDLIPFRKGHLWGYCNRKGEIVLEPRYGLLTTFKHGLAYFGMPNSPEENIFSYELGVISDKFLEISPSKGSQYFLRDGIFDSNFFNSHKEMYLIEGISKYTVERKGFKENKFVNQMAELIIEIDHNVFLSCSRSSDISLKLYLFDKNDDEIDPLFLTNGVNETIGQQLTMFRIQFGHLCINGKYGVIDKEGKNVIPFIYDGMTPFSEGISHVIWNHGNFLIKENGQILNKQSFKKVWFDREERVWNCILENYLYKYYRLNNGEIQEYIIQSNNVFKNGKLLKIEYVNIENGLTRKLFGTAFSRSKEKYLVNKEGKSMLAFPIGFQTKLFYSFAIFKKNEGSLESKYKYGVVDSKADIILPNKFKQLSYLGQGKFLFEDEDYRSKKYYGIIDWENHLTKLFDPDELLHVYDAYEGYSSLDIVPDLENKLLLMSIRTKDGDRIKLSYSSFSGQIYSEGDLAIRFEEKSHPDSIRDFDDFEEEGTYSSNPWDDVFGPGDEADDAYWNTH